MKRLCVFCGSSPGARPAYSEVAADLGRALARGGFGLGYGGSKAGLMGILADAVLAAPGEGGGGIPQALVKKELAHTGPTELRGGASMHERKPTLAGPSDA